MMTRKQKASAVLRRLKKTYKKTGPFLQWSTPLELLVATALSAQCSDERVNIVTKKLFKTYKTAQAYRDADLKALEKAVYSTGFYRNKAKNLKKMGAVLCEQFDGNVPQDFDDLQKIPGVAKKTAAIVLAKAFGKSVSIAVDTHVFRIAKRLGLTSATTVEGVRRDLNALVDKKEYMAFNEYLITHGRAVCVARRPRCAECVLLDLCPAGKNNIKHYEKTS